MATAVKFKPRRGRPSAKQVVAIDAAILQTAKEMFFKEGYDQVAMENVAATTGVSKGTLYTRYPSKEVLFNAVVEASVREWSLASSVEDHQLTDDIAQRLRHHARTAARSLAMEEVQAFRRLLLANSDRFPTLAESMYRQGYQYALSILERDIDDAAVRDGLPVTDAKGVAERIINSIVGWHLQETQVRELPLDELLRFAERTVDIVLAGRAAW